MANECVVLTHDSELFDRIQDFFRKIAGLLDRSGRELRIRF